MVKSYFATERGYGEFKGGWEFPAAKSRWTKHHRKLSICLWTVSGARLYGNLVLKEHEASKWLRSSELNDVAWLPADITLVNKLKF